MRTKTLIFLAILCMVISWILSVMGILEERKMQDECSVLETEIMLLQFENAQLLEMLGELYDRRDKILRRMEQFMDTWEAGDFEATAYTLECGNGDGLTATMTVPREGRTIAVDPAVIRLGSKVFIPGLGWRVAEDTGGMIRGRVIDVYMGSGLAARGAALCWGRKNVKVVHEK